MSTWRLALVSVLQPRSQRRAFSPSSKPFSTSPATPGPAVALIADEAQSLPHELLEEIRLLTNAESKGGRALTVVLVGQPELATRLNEERLRQLKQRITLRCELVPLDLHETAAYVATRLRIAGGKPELIFTRDAISATYDYSRGIPRTISAICDGALVNGFATDSKPISREIVLEVCRDFELSAPSGRIANPGGAKQRRQSRRTSSTRAPTVEPAMPASPVVA